MFARHTFADASCNPLAYKVTMYNTETSLKVNSVIIGAYVLGVIVGILVACGWNELDFNRRDSLKNDVDDSKAKELFSKVKVLVWVMTTQEHHETKALAVKHTWARHCQKVLFMSDVEDEKLPAIAIHSGTGRDHLTGKTMKAFDYIYEHYLKDYDWFMKADDDTYVVMENLCYMLSGEDSGRPIFFGHHYKTQVRQGFLDGGAGYVISKEALRRFGRRKDGLCEKDGGKEDVYFSQCMENLSVTPEDSRDALKRNRFHPFPPEIHINGSFPAYYFSYNKYATNKGSDSVSEYAISFHHVQPLHMYILEYLVYRLRPYGMEYQLDGRI